MEHPQALFFGECYHPDKSVLDIDPMMEVDVVERQQKHVGRDRKRRLKEAARWRANSGFKREIRAQLVYERLFRRRLQQVLGTRFSVDGDVSADLGAVMITMNLEKVADSARWLISRLVECRENMLSCSPPPGVGGGTRCPPSPLALCIVTGDGEPVAWTAGFREAMGARAAREPRGSTLCHALPNLPAILKTVNPSQPKLVHWPTLPEIPPPRPSINTLPPIDGAQASSSTGAPEAPPIRVRIAVLEPPAPAVDARPEAGAARKRHRPAVSVDTSGAAGPLVSPPAADVDSVTPRLTSGQSTPATDAVAAAHAEEGPAAAASKSASRKPPQSFFSGSSAKASAKMSAQRAVVERNAAAVRPEDARRIASDPVMWRLVRGADIPYPIAQRTTMLPGTIDNGSIADFETDVRTVLAEAGAVKAGEQPADSVKLYTLSIPAVAGAGRHMAPPKSPLSALYALAKGVPKGRVAAGAGLVPVPPPAAVAASRC